MDVLTKVADGVATIVLNRPAKKNALTAPMYQAMADALRAAEADAAVRCIVIHGSAEAFTAGNDLEDFLNDPPLGDDAPVFRFLTALPACTKPLVAAVAGPAIGVGTTMLLHCDLVYAGENARFALPFAQLGLCPEAASSLLLPMAVGHLRAAEKLLLGEPFGAAEAVEMGIANAVLPAGEVLPHARRIAERFNALPPGAVRDAKMLMRRWQGDVVVEQIRAEAEIFRSRLRSPEAMEAFSAFFQKRKPDFSKF